MIHLKLILEPFRDPYSWKYCYHHGKSDTQKTAEANAAADRASRDKYSAQAQGTFGQFEGPVQKSPFYKALKTAGIESTSRAYDNARADMREKANLSGFGYNQPVEQGADRELSAAESSALARVPSEAMLEATGPALSAAGATAGIGRGYGADATSYFGDATQMDINRRRSGLFSSLLGLGSLAVPFIPKPGGAGGSGG